MNAQHKLSVLILAAGAGTRMKSAQPKVLHRLCGKPLLGRVLEAVEKLSPASVGVIVGHSGKEVVDSIGAGRRVDFIWQKARKGSGHAVQSAAAWIKKAARRSPDLLILCGDTPLIRPETLSALVAGHHRRGHGATILSAYFENPFGYGRIVRDASGRVRGIVEEKDASPEERLINEVNSGIYCFDAKQLLGALPRLKNDNAKREYYLTDVIGLLHGAGRKVDTVQLADAAETMGVNSRADLALAESLLQKRIVDRWLREGVTMLKPETLYLGEDVQIAQDVEILPGTMLTGRTTVGSGSVIGPNSVVEDSEIGGGVAVRASFVYGSKIGDGAQIGPFTHLRKGTVVESDARIGNFTEIKNSRIGKDTKVSHLSYIGDAELGDGINVGAGAITCNFDGQKKHRTVIGSGSFIGSNVNLVAPVEIGPGSVVGAGSTITRNVPADSLALERSQQVVKEGWTRRRKTRG